MATPCMFANMASFSVEVIEAENPLEVLDYEFVPDTGGAGKFRGGMAQRKTWRMLADEGILQVRADRQTHRPYGLQGGGAGRVRPQHAGSRHADRGDAARQTDHDLAARPGVPARSARRRRSWRRAEPRSGAGGKRFARWARDDRGRGSRLRCGRARRPAGDRSRRDGDIAGATACYPASRCQRSRGSPPHELCASASTSAARSPTSSPSLKMAA